MMSVALLVSRLGSTYTCVRTSVRQSFPLFSQVFPVVGIFRMLEDVSFWMLPHRSVRTYLRIKHCSAHLPSMRGRPGDSVPGIVRRLGHLSCGRTLRSRLRQSSVRACVHPHARAPDTSCVCVCLIVFVPARTYVLPRPRARLCVWCVCVDARAGVCLCVCVCVCACVCLSAYRLGQSFTTTMCEESHTQSQWSLFDVLVWFRIHLFQFDTDARSPVRRPIRAGFLDGVAFRWKGAGGPDVDGPVTSAFMLAPATVSR